MQPLRSYSLHEILDLVDGEYGLAGNPQGKTIVRLMPVGSAEPDALTWLDPQRSDKQRLLDATRAGAVVCDTALKENANGSVLIKVANPKLAFIKLASKMYGAKPQAGVHPSAAVHPEAQVAADVHIGPLCAVGRVTIGAGCVIHSGVQLYDGVTLGRKVTLQSGCVIGVQGFSLTKDEHGEWCNMPHLGGVLIEDGVELQALCVVDRGVLDDTVIGAGTLVNSGCYIGHNVRIGRRNFIAGHTMLSGSVVTGDDCWFGPKTVVRDRLRIGANCFTGTGSVVVRDLEENSRVMGNPARPIDEAKRILSYLRDTAFRDM